MLPELLQPGKLLAKAGYFVMHNRLYDRVREKLKLCGIFEAIMTSVIKDVASGGFIVAIKKILFSALAIHRVHITGIHPTMHCKLK